MRDKVCTLSVIFSGTFVVHLCIADSLALNNLYLNEMLYSVKQCCLLGFEYLQNGDYILLFLL